MAPDQMELRVAMSGGSDDVLAEDAAQLREELCELDVDDVTDAVAGDAPPGSKGLDLAVLGALVVRLSQSRELLREVVDTVHDWLNRNDSHHVRLEIDGDVLDMTGVSAEERKALVDAWVERHAGG